MDVWKIGVSIALTNNMSSVLAAIGQDVLGLDNKVTGLIAKWDALTARTQMAIKGAAGLGVGLALADGMIAATHAGGELVKVQGQLMNLGKDLLDITNQTTAAVQTQALVHGTNAAGNLKVLRELASITPSSEEAIAILPDLMKYGMVIANLKGGKPEDYIQSLTKAAELRGDGVDPVTGKISAQALIGGIKAEVAAIVASGGMVGPQDMLGLVKQAGPMARMSRDPLEFWSGILSAAIDMGGQRAGTAETALGRQLLGGKMGVSTAEEMEKVGLLAKGSWHKAGTGVFVDPGGLAGEDILKGPGGTQAWFASTLVPMIKSAGFVDTPSQMQEFYRLFGTETARRMASLYTQGAAQVEKDAALTKTAFGQNLYGNVMGTDLGANVSGLSEAFRGLMQVLGTPMVKPAIAALSGMTTAISALAGVFDAHPVAKDALMGATGSAALLATGYGIKNIFGAMTSGFGLTTAATALTGSAASLTSAAVALGGSSAAGGSVTAAAVAGGKTGMGMRALSIIPGVIAAAEFFKAGSDDVAALIKQWGTVNVPGKGMIAPGNGRVRNPFEAGQPGVPPIQPIVNVTAPPPATMTGNVILNGSIIGQISAMITKAAAGLGMPSAPPTPNNRALVPTVDSSGGGGGGGF